MTIAHFPAHPATPPLLLPLFEELESSLAGQHFEEARGIVEQDFLSDVTASLEPTDLCGYHLLVRHGSSAVERTYTVSKRHPVTGALTYLVSIEFTPRVSCSTGAPDPYVANIRLFNQPL